VRGRCAGGAADVGQAQPVRRGVHVFSYNPQVVTPVTQLLLSMFLILPHEGKPCWIFTAKLGFCSGQDESVRRNPSSFSDFMRVFAIDTKNTTQLTNPHCFEFDSASRRKNGAFDHFGRPSWTPGVPRTVYTIGAMGRGFRAVHTGA
jgi:hypothetical protein